MRALWEKYFAEAHGVIFVVDACSAERLAEARGALDGVARHPELDAHAPVVVLANKQDRPGALSADEVAGMLGAYDAAGEATGCAFSANSAGTSGGSVLVSGGAVALRRSAIDGSAAVTSPSATGNMASAVNS